MVGAAARLRRAARRRRARRPELRRHLAEAVAAWQVPDAFAVIDEVPKTSVGKFDKKKLRAALADGELDVVRA